MKREVDSSVESRDVNVPSAGMNVDRTESAAARVSAAGLERESGEVCAVTLFVIARTTRKMATGRKIVR